MEARPPETGTLGTLLVTSAYTTAMTTPYSTELAKKGYDAAELDAQLDALETLRVADQEQSRLVGEAQKATRERDLAVALVRKFRSDIRRIARRVFRNEPEQARKLDF